jgi:uncharacterized protein (TIGR02996 family)
MATRESLLAAVCAAPYEDAPRLALAAWLEQQNPPDPQGEYIRLSIRCARESLSDQSDRQRWGSLLDAHDRVAALRAAHEADWKRPILKLATACELERGMVAGVRLSGEAFLKHARQLFDMAPIVYVDLTDVRPVLDALAACDQLRRVRALGTEWQSLTPKEVLVLASSPHIENVWYWGLSGNAIDYDGLRTLATAPRLKTLRHVELESNRVKAHEVADAMGGEINDVWFPPDGEQLETDLGRRVPWLHYPETAWRDYPPSQFAPPPP